MMCLHKYGSVKVTSMQPVKRGEHIKVDWLSRFKQTQFYRSEQHTVLMECSPYCFSVPVERSRRQQTKYQMFVLYAANVYRVFVVVFWWECKLQSVTIKSWI